MMRKILSVLIIVFFLAGVYAAIPAKLSVQFRMQDAGQNWIDENKDVRFRIYDTNVGGSVLWVETHDIVFEDGYGFVELGDSNDLWDLNWKVPYWVGLQVVDSFADAEMSRISLNSVPYAFDSNRCEYLGDGNFDAFVEVSGDTMTGVLGVTDFNSSEEDGASAIAYNYDTQNDLSTSGANLASWKVQGTEKARINKDGLLGLGFGNCSDNLMISYIDAANPTGLCYDGTNWIFKREGSTTLSIGTSQFNLGGGGDSSIAYALNTFLGLNGGGKRINLRSSGILYNAVSKNDLATNDNTFIGDGNFTGTLYANAFVGDGSGITGISTTDTNWETSYNLLDANLALSYYKQADANNIFLKLADVNLSNKVDKNGDTMSGTLNLIQGTQAVPSFSFSTPSTAAMYYDGANIVMTRGGSSLMSIGATTAQFLGGGDSRLEYSLNTYMGMRGGGTTLRVNATGVGVNTTTPTNTLSVNGDLNTGSNGSFAYFDNNGFLNLDQNARFKFQDIIVATTVIKGSSAPTEEAISIGESGTVKKGVLNFVENTQNDVYFEWHPLDNIDNDENAEFHLMWLPASDWTSGNYRWCLEYLVKEEDAGSGDANSVSGNPTTICESITPSNAVDFIETEFTGTLDVNHEQIFLAHFYRDVAADNANADGLVNFFEFEFTANKLGERI